MPLQLFAPRHWPIWIALGVLWLIAQLPGPFRWRIGRWIGRHIIARNKKRTEIVELNLAWALPELTDGERVDLAQESNAFGGQMLIDYGFCWWASQRRFKAAIEFEGLEPIEALLEQGEAVMFITSHALALDIGGVALSQRLPMVGFVNKMRNPLIQWMIERGRCRFDVKLLQRESGMRPLIRSIKGGRLLYYVVDEDMTKQSVFAPYFGVTKATLIAPARVARITGAKVAPCFTFFDQRRGRYMVRIGAPLEAFPTGDDLQDAITVNRALEHDIRQSPGQYMWSQRLYKSRPDGSPPPYTMIGSVGSGPRPRPKS